VNHRDIQTLSSAPKACLHSANHQSVKGSFQETNKAGFHPFALKVVLKVDFRPCVEIDQSFFITLADKQRIRAH
jgi:hypothetical protein